MILIISEFEFSNILLQINSLLDVLHSIIYIPFLDFFFFSEMLAKKILFEIGTLPTSLNILKIWLTTQVDKLINPIHSLKIKSTQLSLIFIIFSSFFWYTV